MNIIKAATTICLLVVAYTTNCQSNILDSPKYYIDSLPLYSTAESVIADDWRVALYDDRECGTWEVDSTHYHDWHSVDTLGLIHGEQRSWIYEGIKHWVDYQHVRPMHCPCGCGYSSEYTEHRICQLTGIRQKRLVVITYKYIEKPLTDYEKAVQRFKE